MSNKLKDLMRSDWVPMKVRVGLVNLFKKDKQFLESLSQNENAPSSIRLKAKTLLGGATFGN